MNKVYCLTYATVADGWTDNGIWRNVFFKTRSDARKEMREAYKEMRRNMKSDYDLENFDDSRKADRYAFSADSRVSFVIEVVEISEQ